LLGSKIGDCLRIAIRMMRYGKDFRWRERKSGGESGAAAEEAARDAIGLV